MRRIVLCCFLWIAAWPMGAHAQAECNGSGLQLEAAAHADGAFRMQDTVRIRATSDACRSAIDAANKPGALKPVRVFIGDVEMRGIGARLQRAADGSREIAFRLERDSADANSRKDWTQMLSKPGQGYVLEPALALAIGSDAPLQVTGAQGKPFQMTIVDGVHVFFALAIGLAVFVGGFVLMKRNASLLRDAPSGHYSLGRTQMAFWSLLVFLCWAAVWLLTQTREFIPNQTLMLMGISAATGLAAAFIGQPPADRKAALEAEATALRAKPAATPPVALTAEEQVRLAGIDQTLKLLAAAAARPPRFWRDLCDDGNGPSFQRLQVVVWTLALGVVFIASVATTMAMPEFDPTLLLLMGLSNGTYLGFKFTEKT